MKLSLSSILIFALVTPVIMTYRISPGNTPYFLFGLIFLGILLFILLDIFSLSDKLRFRLKVTLLSLMIIFTIGATIFSEIIVRHQSSPIYNVHDIVVQQEAAIRYLLDGKNPYSTTYFGTPLEQWNYSPTEINPALFHFVMQPVYLYFALPFYFLSNMFFGFFDARIPLFALFLLSLVIAFLVAKRNEDKLLFMILIAFNPATVKYTIEGRSDFYVFAFLLVSLYALSKKYISVSSIVLALSFAIKQSIWPLFPIYFMYLYFKHGRKPTLRSLLLFCTTFILTISPFLIWDYRAYVDSTILYLSGNTPNSYPISGYGFGMVLHQLNVIKDLNLSFPFLIIQTVVGVPVLFVLLRFMKKHLSIKVLLFSYGIFLFVFWYFSRYFNNSHVGYLTMIFIAAYFWEEDVPKGENSKR